MIDTGEADDIDEIHILRHPENNFGMTVFVSMRTTGPITLSTIYEKKSLTTEVKFMPKRIAGEGYQR